MERESILDEWLSACFGSTDFSRAPLSGDASFRRYFRVGHNQQSYVLMDAPPPESPALFVKIGKALANHGLVVPKIIAENLEQGFLLLSDFGDQLYLNALNRLKEDNFVRGEGKENENENKNENENEKDKDKEIHLLYEQAIHTLVQLNQCQAEDVLAFDEDFLMRQLGFFEDWYLKKHLKLSEKIIAHEKSNRLQSIYDTLISVMMIQPTVFVHRDYHSRNLMIVPELSVVNSKIQTGINSETKTEIKSDIKTSIKTGILDFQDAMIGPITYDLVSLLQDCYISWPRSFVEEKILLYKNIFNANDVIKANDVSKANDAFKLNHISKTNDVSDAEFIRWFDYTGLHRHLKNLGIFARLLYRDNKPGYIKDIPQVLKYVKEICLRYSELAPLWEWLGPLVIDEGVLTCAR